MLSVQQLSKDRPSQLMLSSLVRARMCEMLAGEVGMGHRQIELFMLGLLSLMGTMLCCPLENVLARMPVAPDVRDALVRKKGPLRGLHLTVRAIENNRVNEAWELAEQFGINWRQLCAAYAAATHWADQVMEP
jgi:EAL and modified HD-GYP domain-containing signal transduction protein